MNPGSLAPVRGSRTGAGAAMGDGSNLELVLTSRAGLKLGGREPAGAHGCREHATPLREQQASTDTRLTLGVSRGTASGRCATFIRTGSPLPGWLAILPALRPRDCASGVWGDAQARAVVLLLWPGRSHGLAAARAAVSGRAHLGSRAALSSFPGPREDQIHCKFGSYKGS